MHGRFWLLLPLLWLPWAASSAPDTVTVYTNARVWMGTSLDDFSEAFAIRGNRIIAVGGDDAVLARAGRDSRRTDLDGALVVPGFIDNHTHFVTGALALAGVNLRDAETPDEFARRIAARAEEAPGKWITGGNWDHELWGGELPKREWIDEYTGSTPVFVIRLDGHMGLANSAALELAGINASTSDPIGGEITRDEEGRPTGLLKDTAMSPVLDLMPEPDEDDIQEALRRAFDLAVRHGVTQIHDMGDWRSLDAFRTARQNGQLGIRVYSFVPLADWQKLANYVEANGKGDDWHRWGGVKGFVDGSLGSTTAWFHEPYTDAPGTSGLTMIDTEILAAQIRDAHTAGLHVAVHAIGDRANDWLLDTYDRLLQAGPAGHQRFRIEHAQHLTRSAIERIGDLGVIPSMQPYHAIDDGRWAEKRIGAERLKGTYAFRSLLDAGAKLTFGSDWRVAPLDPFTGIDAAVNRQTIDGRNPQGWQPQERTEVAEALYAYTAANAFAGYQEERLGKIAPGYLADFVVLSDDIFAVDPEGLPQVEVMLTVIDGQTRYRSNASASMSK